MTQLELPFPEPQLEDLQLKFTGDAVRSLLRTLERQWFHPVEEAAALRLIELLQEHVRGR